MTRRDDASFRRNRRAFLGRSAGSFGMMALAHLLDQDDRRARPGDRGGRRRKPPAGFRSQCPGQVGDLPVPARRAEPDGPVRPQARAARSTTASRTPAQLEIHFNKPGGQRAGLAVQVPPAGAIRGWCSASCCPTRSAIADEITLVRSMTTESVDHEAALRLIHTGKILAGRPTWGSWVIYALGTENQNLPAYVVLSDPGGLPVDGVRNWSSGWLPAVYQGTPVPLRAARRCSTWRRPGGVTPEARAGQLRFLDALNRATWAATPATPSWRPGSPTSRSPPGCRRRSPRPSTWRASPRASAGCTAWTTRPAASTARAA